MARRGGADLRVQIVGDESQLERSYRRSERLGSKYTASVKGEAAAQSRSYLSMSGAGKKAAAELEGSHNRMASSMVGIGRSSNIAVAGLVGLSAAAYAARKAGDTLAEVGKETLALHNVTGLSIKSASAYAAVAKVQEIPVKGLNQAFGTLSKNLHAVENAHSGASKSAHTQETALRQLGVPLSVITKAHGDLNKVLPEITKRFEAMPGSVQKTAIGMALFGRGWQTLVPLMHTGALGLKEQLDVATKMGATLGGKSVKDLKQFAKAQEEAKYANLGLSLAMGQYVAPALTKVIVGLAKVSHGLGDGVHWLKDHATAAKAAAVAIGTVLGGALTVFAYTKAVQFVGATKAMIGGMKTAAEKIGLSAAGVDASMAGTARSAETAAAKTKAAEAAATRFIVASDGTIVEANAAAGASFGAMAGKAITALSRIGLAIGGAMLAIKGLESGIGAITGEPSKVSELLGGGQPGESGREGEVWAKKHGGFGGAAAHQQRLDTGGGIMGYFMSKGLSAAQAAGIVGNLQQESGLNPSAAGGGLDQGQGGRLHRGSVKQQLEAMWQELETTERGTLAALRAAKSPQEAARIFSQRFERPGKPMLSNRERYAAEAYAAHPQAHHQPHQAAATPEATGSLGYYQPAAAHKAARHVKGEAAAAPAQIDRWAEASVGRFAESWGKNRGPELDKLQSEFHTRAAAWCAEFATTAAMMGGANKAVRTASVATIREWAEQGSHGFKKGVGHTPHVGDMMMFGNAHVGFVQSVHGSQVTTVEGNTRAGKVATVTHAASEGDYASPLYRRLTTGAGLLKNASKVYEQAAKRAEQLLLSPRERTAIASLSAGAAGARGEVGKWAGFAADNAGALEAGQARWAARPLNLATAAGATAASQRAFQVVASDKAQKRYYEREVQALRGEARQWGKLRDQYRKIARHTPDPHAKKQALDKAAMYQARVEQAQAGAKELGGKIEAKENDIATAEAAQAALPGEVQAADLGAYQAANAKVDLEQRAGLLTEAQAKAAKEANARNALAGGYGALSDEGRLQVQGDLIEFGKALESATNAVEAHTQALKDSEKALNDFLHASERLASLENGTILKGLADLISGQIGGVNYHGRQMTAGAGSAARY